MKKVVSVVLCLVLMLSAFSVVPTSVNAASGVTDKINSLLSLFPNGSYFSKNGSACGHGAGSSCSNCKLSNILTRSDLSGLGYSKGVDYTDGYTCVAFARFAFRYVFGTSFSSSNYQSVKSGSFNQSLFSSAKTGDIIGFYNSSGTFQHYAMFIGDAGSSSAKFYQANFGGTPKVAYGYWSYSNMNSCYGSGSYGVIYRAKNYDSANGPHIHSYDTYVWFNGQHPHYNCYQCVCGDVQANTSEPTYWDLCETCQNHTHSYDTYVWFNGQHPHYKCYKCSICGEVQANTSEPTYWDLCETCQNHTHSYDTYVWFNGQHPHYKCYQCICGDVQANTSEPTYWDLCETCTHTHNYDKYVYYWDAHPHYSCYECSCGDVKENREEPRYVDTCIYCVYEAAPKNYGDVNGDSSVTAADALEILKTVVGKASLSAEQKKKAEVSGDGAITANDALLILKKVVGKIDRFPVEG